LSRENRSRTRKGERYAARQRNHDEGRFDVVTSLECVIPMVEKFGDVTAEADQQNDHCSELEGTAPHALILSFGNLLVATSTAEVGFVP